jgi:hypothetical protein
LGARIVGVGETSRVLEPVEFADDDVGDKEDRWEYCCSLVVLLYEIDEGL